MAYQRFFISVLLAIVGGLLVAACSGGAATPLP